MGARALLSSQQAATLLTNSETLTGPHLHGRKSPTESLGLITFQKHKTQKSVALLLKDMETKG